MTLTFLIVVSVCHPHDERDAARSTAALAAEENDRSMRK
jgi:hypothetical protein